MTAAIRKQNIRIPAYSVSEEIFNAVTHWLGAAFGAAALALMIQRVRGGRALLCVLAYGLSIILLYGTSALYHGIPAASPKKGRFRIADHCMVFVLVLGTCVPVFLLGIGGTAGGILLAFVSVTSVLGVGLTVWNMDRTEKICTALHLLNGWSVVLGAHWLVENVGWKGTVWMLAGGIVYSAGVVFFALGASKRWMHGVFHLFCLAGTVLQFLGICGYVL